MYIPNRRAKDPHTLTKLERMLAMYIIFKYTGSYTVLLDKWMADNNISRRTVLRDCEGLERSGLAVDVKIQGDSSRPEIYCKREQPETSQNDEPFGNMIEIPINQLSEEALSDPHVLKLRRLALLTDYLFRIDNPDYQKIFIAFKKSYESVMDDYYDAVWRSYYKQKGAFTSDDSELNTFQNSKQSLTARGFLDFLNSEPGYSILVTSIRNIQREIKIIYKICEW